MSKPAVGMASLLAALALTVVGLGVLVVTDTESGDARFALLAAIERTKASRYVHIETRGPWGTTGMVADYEAPDRIRQTWGLQPKEVAAPDEAPAVVVVVIGDDRWSRGFRRDALDGPLEPTLEHCSGVPDGAAALSAFGNLTALVRAGSDFEATRRDGVVAVSFSVSTPTPDGGEQRATGVVRLRDGRIADISGREEGRRSEGAITRYTYDSPTDPIEPPPAELVTSSRGSCNDES